MLTIPQQQLFDRFDTIPDSLKEGLFDEASVDFIWKTCEDEHLPEESIDVVSMLTGYVYMGFLHPEDLAEEIKEHLNIDLRIATAIQDDLNKRIFAPLRPDLDKIYQPLGKRVTVPASPTIIQDINTSAPSFISPSPAQPKPAPAMPAVPLQSPTPPAAPKTDRLSDVGWSRSGTAAPVIKLDVSQMPKTVTAPAPSAPKQQTPAPQPTGSGPKPPLGEFERLNAMKKAPSTPVVFGVLNPTPKPVATATASVTPTTPAVTPKPANTPTDPAPMILHEDSSFKSQEKNTAFTLPKPGAAAQMQMNAIKPQAPVRPAVLEFGTSNNAAPTKPTPATGSAKVTHYTEFNTSLSSVPTANTGPRTVSEVATPPASANVPMPTPPRPPMPPQPPQTSQSGQPGSVIVKDFL